MVDRRTLAHHMGQAAAVRQDELQTRQLGQVAEDGVHNWETFVE